MTEYVSLKFDSNQMIHLLGVQLYDTPLAMLRENVQNAVDAIRERKKMDTKLFYPMIKVTISDGMKKEFIRLRPYQRNLIWQLHRKETYRIKS